LAELPVIVFWELILNQFIAPILLMDFPKVSRKLSVIKVEDVHVNDHHVLQVICQDTELHQVEILINQNTKRLIMIFDPHQSLGIQAISRIIWGIPGIICASPAIIAMLLVRGMIVLASGKDWHQLALWHQINKQLPVEVAKQVHRALKGS